MPATRVEVDRVSAQRPYTPVRSPTATAGVIPRSRPCSQDRHLSRTIGTSGRNVGCVPATLPSTTRRHLAHDGRGRYSRISSPRSRHSRTLLTDVTHGSRHISLSAIQRPGPGGAPEGEAGHDSLTSRRRNGKHPERPPTADSLGPQVETDRRRFVSARGVSPIEWSTYDAHCPTK